MLMQFTIQKQKGFPHGMTFHTEFHRPLPKTKGSPKGAGGGSFLPGVYETLYEMLCHLYSKLHQHMKPPMIS